MATSATVSSECLAIDFFHCWFSTVHRLYMHVQVSQRFIASKLMMSLLMQKLSLTRRKTEFHTMKNIMVIDTFAVFPQQSEQYCGVPLLETIKWRIMPIKTTLLMM